MDNSSYLSQVYQPIQDVSGLQPVFQNIGAQQALHNQLMQQQQQEMQDASNIGASYGKSMGGLNPLAMASMLRGGSNFGNSGMSSGMTNGGVTGNIYDNSGQLLTTGNSAPSAATWNQAFGGIGGMDR
jgi:hypothetical protein